MTSSSDNQLNPIDEIFRLFAAYGASTYDEAVTLTQHCEQTAACARAEGASDALTAAALLHDLGHFLLAERTGHENFRTTDWTHDSIAADWLRPHFGPAVAEPVGLHVEAKRWLCATDPDYINELSGASIDSLAVQGGVHTPGEAEAFGQLKYAADAALLRRWDDCGKVEGLTVDPVESYEPMLRSLQRCQELS